MRFASYRAIGGGKTGARSYNAQHAEADGRLPAARAAKEWGFKSAAALKEWVPTSEWHHVSKFANVVRYYDVAKFIEEGYDFDISTLNDLAAALTKKGKRKVLPGMVRSRVHHNLTAYDPRSTAYHKSTQRGSRPQKHVSTRLRELAAKHGVQLSLPWGENPVGRLDEKSFLSWLKREKANIKP